jgi:hypothetical protein
MAVFVSVNGAFFRFQCFMASGISMAHGIAIFDVLSSSRPSTATVLCIQVWKREDYPKQADLAPGHPTYL